LRFSLESLKSYFSLLKYNYFTKKRCNLSIFSFSVAIALLKLTDLFEIGQFERRAYIVYRRCVLNRVITIWWGKDPTLQRLLRTNIAKTLLKQGFYVFGAEGANRIEGISCHVF